MLDGIERSDIFLARRPGEQQTEQVGDALTGVVFEKVAYVQDGGNLSAVSAAQGDNTLIIVSNGTITTTGTHAIQGSQTIQGGSSTIPVYGVVSGTVVDFTAPGARPTLASTGTGNLSNTRILGNHTHLAGFSIDGN